MYTLLLLFTIFAIIMLHLVSGVDLDPAQKFKTISTCVAES